MIKLYTDHYFQIGGSHLISGKPCQDYVISDIYKDAAYAVASDGCSTGRHTDVGSRVLALSTACAIREHWTATRNAMDESAATEVKTQGKIVLAGIRQNLGLIHSDMLATCIYVYLSPVGGFVHVQGDGVVALKYRNGSIAAYRYEWEDNAPFYPAYQGNPALDNFIKKHGGNLDALRFSEESLLIESDVEYPEPALREYSLSQGIRGVTICITPEMLEELEFVAAFSDGVTQIDGVDWKDAVVRFLSFKNSAGEFAKRRMIKGIKDVKKTCKGPIDDIGYAVVRVEKVEDEAPC
jgi:hypothetical protein